MSHLALYRKWRPSVFDDVFGQEHITDALRAQVENGRVSHAYLFCGTRGTGKTTCAKILARAACCERPVHGNPCNECPSCRAILEDSALDVTEIDAASNNGVDNIREIRDEAVYAPSALRRRVYIIDEVHMLSAGAFNALLKTLEEPPAHVLFILATTELHKVPATVLSRCQRYDFRRIAPSVIARRLLGIASGEGLALSEDAAALLARLGDGSMRDAISLLDRCVGDGDVTAETVAQALGLTSNEALDALFSALLAGDVPAALAGFSESYRLGRDITSLFDELLSLIRDLYVLKATGKADYLASSFSYDVRRLSELASACDAATLEFFLTTINDLLTRLTRTAIRRTDAEMCLVKLCLRTAPQTPAAPAATLAAVSVPQRTAPAEKPVAAEKPAPEEKPQRTEAMSSGDGDCALRASFAEKVAPRVNPAVRAYLELSDVSGAEHILHLAVPEESVVFMEKPTNVELFTTAARELGFSEVRVSKKGEKKPALSAGASDLLSNAAKLGIPIKKA
ncbi:MAG: DNA polymerase III, subunit gamma and tau [Clostridium sp. SCN 57-10]|nr:MAG: DNA polymerase III, subunit gamma and tau [Clostridium sp. SCN 57-10]